VTVAIRSPCADGIIAGAQPAQATHALASTTAHPTALLLATVLGSSVAFIDSSVVNVALPVIGRDLSATVAETQWLINGYLLPLSALVLLGGAAGDRFGRRRVFMIGLSLFTLGSLACALAPDVRLLIAARALQGVGAALLTPTSLALLGAGFAGEARGRAIGTWAAAGAITAAVGPVVGGWLVDVVGWRAIFLINIPVAAAALWLAIRYVPDTAERVVPASVDWLGAALAVLGLGTLVWGLTVLPTRGHDDPVVLVALVIGGLALVAFVLVEHRLGDRAMVPLALFKSRTFAGVALLTLFLYAALGGLFVLLPYVLITVGHYPATVAGAALLPAPILMGLGSRAVGQWTIRVGPRVPLTIGPLLVAVGFLLGLRLDVGHLSYWPDVFPMALSIASGMALSVAPLTSTVMASVDPSRAGSASGADDAIAYQGALIATALLGLVLVPGGSTGLSMADVHKAALAGAALATTAAASALLFV
jgi:EmrB/QacA subfamily drug resistance transporter